MENYQLIPAEYFQQQYDLAVYAFNVEATEERKQNIETQIKHSLSVGAFHNDSLSAQVMITPFTVHFHQCLYKMGGIGMVSSYPEYRGTGNVTALMKRSLQIMNDEGMALSYLAPFSFSFYRKYGFEQLFDHLKTTLTPDQLPRIKKRRGKLERVSWIEGKKDLTRLYEKQTGQAVGAIQREVWWWEHSTSSQPKQKIVLYKNEQDKSEGYLIYQFNEDTFQLKELIYETHHAYEMLWAFVSTHSSSFKYFEYESQMNENNAYLLDDPYIKQEYKPVMMGRIVNFQRFLQPYPYAKANSKDLYLRVFDDTAPWNDGLWRLNFSDNRPEIILVNKNTSQLNLENELFLEGNIQTWTQILFGYRSARELHFFNRLTGSQEAITELDSILPKGTPVLLDYF